MFDQLADPNPPTDTSHVRRRIEFRLRRRRQHRMVGGAAAVVAAAVAISLLVTSTAGSGARVIVGGSPAARGSRPSPASSFLVVASTERHVKELTLDHKHYFMDTYAGAQLQERNIHTGKVEAILLNVSSNDSIDASFLPDGDVLVGLSYAPDCGATLLSIDPATGTAKTVAHLSDSILGLTGLTVSPNGEFAAYMAYPGCQGGTPIPTTTVASNRDSPTSTVPETSTTVPESSLDYVAVRNLATGATEETPYGEQGDATAGNGPVWSPSSGQVAVISPQGTKTTIFSSGVGHHPPHRKTAYRLGSNVINVPAPSRCSIGSIGAWTTSGITEVLNCEAKLVGRYNPRKPPKQWNVLEQVAQSGLIQNKLTVPACDDVQSLESSASNSLSRLRGTTEPPVVVESDNTIAITTYPPTRISGCSGPVASRLAAYMNGHLTTFATLTSPPISLPG